MVTRTKLRRLQIHTVVRQDRACMGCCSNASLPKALSGHQAMTRNFQARRVTSIWVTKNTCPSQHYLEVSVSTLCMMLITPGHHTALCWVTDEWASPYIIKNKQIKNKIKLTIIKTSKKGSDMFLFFQLCTSFIYSLFSLFIFLIVWLALT